MQTHPLIIGEQQVDETSNWIDVSNPFDGGAVGRVPMGDAKLLDAAVDAAQHAFEATTRRMPPFERSRILATAAQLLASRRGEFADTIVAEAGKPITMAEAEVDRCVITLTAAAEEARRSQGEMLDVDGFGTGKGHVGIVRRFPIGVIYGLTPFNFPLNLVAHKVAPAIASGNAIVIKPSPRTPISSIKLARILLEAGAPAGQVNVVTCPNDLATHPIDDPRVKHVSFTGSAPVGWQIKQRAANKRVTLELGGNAGLIVHEDADLDLAVPSSANGAFGYAGQSCISVQRILIHERVYDRFRDAIVEYTRKSIRSGDPRDRGVLVGPMIDSAAIERTRRTIDEAVRGGAKVPIGNEVVGPCLAPTIVENADLKSQLCNSEIFAPVATLHSFKTFDEAIAIANDTPYGLQAGVFTRDIKLAWRAFEGLQVGGVMINQAPTFRVETMPYGGVKQSGFGREGIRYAMEEMTEPRAMVVRLE